MIGRFSPWVIVDAHFATLRDYAPEGEERRHRLGVWLLYAGFPLVVTACSLALRIHLTEGTVGILITSMSIFAALLFNLLMIVYDIIRKWRDILSDEEEDEDERRRSQLRKVYLREIYANISFAVLTTIFVVVLLLTWLVVPEDSSPSWRLSLSLLIYYFIMLFLLTFLMVLRRVHILLTDEMR